jgi:hypothetical protein
MHDKHLPFNYPSSVLLRPVMGSFVWAQSQQTLAAMQLNGLACRNWMGDYVGLAVYWVLRLS